MTGVVGGLWGEVGKQAGRRPRMHLLALNSRLLSTRWAVPPYWVGPAPLYIPHRLEASLERSGQVESLSQPGRVTATATVAASAAAGQMHTWNPLGPARSLFPFCIN